MTDEDPMMILFKIFLQFLYKPHLFSESNEFLWKLWGFHHQEKQTMTPQFLTISRTEWVSLHHWEHHAALYAMILTKVTFIIYLLYAYKSYSVNSHHLNPGTISTNAFCYMFQSLNKLFYFCISHIWLNTTRSGQTTPQPACQNCVGKKHACVLQQPTAAGNPDGRSWSRALAGHTA